MVALLVSSCTNRDGINNLKGDNYYRNNTADKSRRFIQNSSEHEIFYGLYSPDEVSRMLKSSGLRYKPEAFLPVEKADKYSSSSKQAVSLGIYGADFSIAKLFDDTEEAVKYMKVIGQLSEKLGVPLEMLDNSVSEIEQKLGDIDSLSYVVSEVFTSSTEFLLETGRESAISLIMMGGWIEGIYQILNIIETDTLPDPVLIEAVISQKYSLDFLLTLMKNQYEDPDVAYYYRLFEVLATHFEKLQIYYMKGELKIDTAAKLINTSWSKYDYSLASLEDIKQIVSGIRSILIET